MKKRHDKQVYFDCVFSPQNTQNQQSYTASFLEMGDGSTNTSVLQNTMLRKMLTLYLYV
mgnify:CR=1 FL=1